MLGGLWAATPVITSGPVPRQVTVGSMATFSVQATGTAPLAYSWLKEGVAISGATNAVYSIPAVALSDAGNYSVRVSNAEGGVDSSVVALTVNAASTISYSLKSSVPSIGPVAGKLTLTADLNYAKEAPPTSLGLTLVLPSGWEL